MIEIKAIDQDRMAERALGQIEGTAFCQSDLLRDILMGAVEDIDEAMKQQRARIKELEESAEGSTGLLEFVIKQKDELLTENARLREQVEGRGLDTHPALRATSPIVGEAGTSPAIRATSTEGEGGERIAASGIEAPPRNDNDEVQKEYCLVCRDQVNLFWWGGIRITVRGNRLLVATDNWETCSTIKFCPKCGRKL